MNATVISVRTGLIGQSKNGEYEYMDFTYKPDDYRGQEKDPVTRKVFANLPVHDEIVDLGLVAGDYVGLDFEKNGKFTNLVGIKKLGKKPAAPSGGGSSGGGGGSGRAFVPPLSFDERLALDVRKDRGIAKQVALKAAVDLTVAGIAAKIIKEVDGSSVLLLAKELDKLFADKTVLDKVKDTLKAAPKHEDEEPPFDPDDDIPF